VVSKDIKTPLYTFSSHMYKMQYLHHQTCMRNKCPGTFASAGDPGLKSTYMYEEIVCRFLRFVRCGVRVNKPGDKQRMCVCVRVCVNSCPVSCVVGGFLGFRKHRICLNVLV